MNYSVQNTNIPFTSYSREVNVLLFPICHSVKSAIYFACFRNIRNISIDALMTEKKKTTNTNLIRLWLRHWPNFVLLSFYIPVIMDMVVLIYSIFAVKQQVEVKDRQLMLSTLLTFPHYTTLTLRLILFETFYTRQSGLSSIGSGRLSINDTRVKAIKQALF